ncbi:MAG: hypothetical protein M3Q56_01770 [Bacteroidota bacterium]|nr:hypothetical protein [Bacteroidota bacterium]
MSSTLNNPFYPILIICLLFASVTQSQINLQVGYSYSYANPKTNNDILRNYNRQNSWFTKSFKPIFGIQGAVLGLTYNWPKFSFGSQWTYRSKNLDSRGISPIDQSEQSLKLIYVLQTYSLVLESKWEHIGVGLSFDINLLNIKEQLNHANDKLDILKHRGIGNRVFLSIPLATMDFMQISVQPFYQFQWTPFDLQNLAKSLNPSSNPMQKEEPFQLLGLTLMLNNGPQ